MKITQISSGCRYFGPYPNEKFCNSYSLTGYSRIKFDTSELCIPRIPTKWIHMLSFKVRTKETEERVKILARENERMQKKVELLQEELGVLRSSLQ